jgi:hypothetical protein
MYNGGTESTEETRSEVMTVDHAIPSYDLFNPRTINQNVFVDFMMPYLTDPEWKVYSYAIRHTIGWRKDDGTRAVTANISLKDFTDGIENNPYHNGCGKNRRTVQNCLGVLEQLNLLIPEGEPHPQYGQSYRLVVDPDTICWKQMHQRYEKRKVADKKRTEKARRTQTVEQTKDVTHTESVGYTPTKVVGQTESKDVGQTPLNQLESTNESTSIPSGKKLPEDTDTKNTSVRPTKESPKKKKPGRKPKSPDEPKSRLLAVRDEKGQNPFWILTAYHGWGIKNWDKATPAQQQAITGRIAVLLDSLTAMDIEQAITVQEFKEFAAWYKKHNSGANFVLSENKLAEKFAAFRIAKTQHMEPNPSVRQESGQRQYCGKCDRGRKYVYDTAGIILGQAACECTKTQEMA